MGGANDCHRGAYGRGLGAYAKDGGRARLGGRRPRVERGTHAWMGRGAHAWGRGAHAWGGGECLGEGAHILEGGARMPGGGTHA
jgi:hypothetical protein